MVNFPFTIIGLNLSIFTLNGHLFSCSWTDFIILRTVLFISIVRAKVNKTINCIRRTYNICFGTDYARHFESVRVQFTETSMCHEGALGLPTSHSLEVLAAHCPESFSTNLNNCLKSFQGTFARDKTDPDLCK